MKQNRWKSKVMWLSIGSAVVLIYNAVAANFELPVLAEGMAETILNAILGVLVTFGVINNPTSSNTL